MCGVNLLLASNAFATSCAGQETTVLSCSNSINGVWSILLIVINILAAGVGIVAVGGIIYAALLYTSASDDASQVSKAKSTILNVAIGIISFGLLYSGLQFIIPGGFMHSLLNPPSISKEDDKTGDGGPDEPDSSVKTIHVTHLHSSGRFDRSVTGWKSDLQKFDKQYSPDIITITEAVGRTSAVDWTGWSHTNGESVVAWDTSKWKKVNADVKELAPDTPFYRGIVMSAVVLEHRVTKTKWLFTSSHIPSSVDDGDGKFSSDAQHVTKWKASMASMSSIVNSILQKNKIELRHSVITADWNINLAQPGWRNVMKNYFPNRSPSNPIGSAGTHGNRTIDTSFVSSDLNVENWHSLGTIPSSDHKPFVAKYSADK